MKYDPVKTIFQVRYDPKLSFYDRLFKDEEIASLFPDWQTDRLKVTFRDYEKKHSLSVAFNNTVYESDLFYKKNEKEVFKLLSTKMTNFVDDGKFSRFGLRRFFLINKEIQFPELVEILNLKLFNSEFQRLFQSSITDSTVIVNSSIDDYQYRLVLGPMKRTEISKFIKYNVDNHIHPDANTRIDELHKVFNSYPEASLFLDLDFFIEGKGLKQEAMAEFFKSAEENMTKIIDQCVSMIFEEKVKK